MNRIVLGPELLKEMEQEIASGGSGSTFVSISCLSVALLIFIYFCKSS